MPFGQSWIHESGSIREAKMTRWFRKKPLVFSEEAGITPLPVMQLEEITLAVRRDIIDCLQLPSPYRGGVPYLYLVTLKDHHYYSDDRTQQLVYSWLDIMARTLQIHRTQCNTQQAVSTFLNKIHEGPYYEVLDIVGRIVNEFDEPSPPRVSENDIFRTLMKHDSSHIVFPSGDFIHYNGTIYLKDMVDIFDNNGAAYRLNIESYPYRFLPVTSDLQANLLKSSHTALRLNQMDGSLFHLNKANEFFINKHYADSVKESVHAIESVVQRRYKTPSFSKSLEKMSQEGHLNHPALQKALKALYGWASNEEGVRHSLITQSEDSITREDALLLIGICAPLAAYLANS